MASQPGEQDIRKIYFIKRPAMGEELLTLLKNKFKLLDAIRDLIDWTTAGRDFTCTLRDWPEDQRAGEEQILEIAPWQSGSENDHSLMRAVSRMVDWLDQERSFDIALVPNRTPHRMTFS